MHAGDIIAALPTLSASELAQVKTAIQVLSKEGERAETNDSEEVVWRAFQTSAGKQGVELPPFERVKRSNAYKAFREGSVNVLRFVEQAFQPKSKTERVHALMICARALLRFLKQIQVPWAVSTIANNLCNVSAAIESAWPGYAQAHALHCILSPADMGRVD